MTEARDESPAEPRLAATVILVTGGAERLEVLLVRRNPEQRFMGGAWVFPGGSVDPGEDERQAAIREVEEEADVVLPDPAALKRYARWITPPQLPIRFDTHFFIERLPGDADPRPDGSECVDLRLMTPQQALDDDAVELHFPTRKTLEQLAGFASADDLLAWSEGREPEPITPHVVMEGEVARVVLPGEPGYASDP